jgi:hypothetical protein
VIDIPPPLALARECEALDRDRGAWEEISARGVAGVAARHSPDVYGSAVERIYGRLIDEASASP